MIRQESMLNVADNSGAKKIKCIRILGGTRKKYASVGDKIVATVKKAMPKGNVKKKEVVNAVIVRTKKEKRRPDGSFIRFSDNAAAIVNKNNEPRATRIPSPIAREVRKNFNKVASLANEIY